MVKMFLFAWDIIISNDPWLLQTATSGELLGQLLQALSLLSHTKTAMTSISSTILSVI